MPEQPLIVLDGWRELNRLFAKSGPEANKEMKALVRQMAEPVQAEAEGLARSSFRKPVGHDWDQMRIGVTQKVVYVSPRKRGVKHPDDPRARPKFGTLMERRVFAPTAEHQQPFMERRTEALFDEFARRWNTVGA